MYAIYGDMDPINKNPSHVSIFLPAPWIRHGQHHDITPLFFRASLKLRLVILSMNVPAGATPSGTHGAVRCTYLWDLQIEMTV